MKRLSALLTAALFLLPGCVSVDGPPMSKGEVQKGQRTIILVFASPTPVMTAEESNVSTAIDIIPGVGELAQSARNDSNVAVSRDVAQNLPPWDPSAEFRDILKKELDRSGNPGQWVLPADTEILADRIAGWNQADSVADWVNKYYGLGPIPPTAPRNYARIPGISDALIFEANLAWGLDADPDLNETPTLSCRARLYSAADNKLLWSQEEVLTDAGFKGSLETLKPNGDQLLTHWRGLMQHLASSISDDFRKSLVSAGLYAGPSLSTETVSGAGEPASAYSLHASTASAYHLNLSTTAYTLPPPAAPTK